MVSRADRSLLPGAPPSLARAFKLDIGPLGQQQIAYHPDPIIEVGSKRLLLKHRFVIRNLDPHRDSYLGAQWQVDGASSFSLAVTPEGRLVLSLIDSNESTNNTIVRVLSRDCVIHARMHYEVEVLKSGKNVSFKVNGIEIPSAVEPGSTIPEIIKASGCPVTIGNVFRYGSRILVSGCEDVSYNGYYYLTKEFTVYYQSGSYYHLRTWAKPGGRILSFHGQLGAWIIADTSAPIYTNAVSVDMGTYRFNLPPPKTGWSFINADFIPTGSTAMVLGYDTDETGWPASDYIPQPLCSDAEIYSYLIELDGVPVIQNDNWDSFPGVITGAKLKLCNTGRLPKGVHAIDIAASRAFNLDPQVLVDVTDPDLCPLSVLPFLAWAYSVDEWPAGATEAEKRATIKASISVHRRKGSLQAIRDVLATSGYGSAIVTIGEAMAIYDGTFSHDGSIVYASDSGWASWSIIIENSDQIPSDSLIALLVQTAPARCKLISVGYQKLIFRYNSAFAYDGTRQYQRTYTEAA